MIGKMLTLPGERMAVHERKSLSALALIVVAPIAAMGSQGMAAMQGAQGALGGGNRQGGHEQPRGVASDESVDSPIMPRM
jgi:hypothetical protein